VQSKSLLATAFPQLLPQKVASESGGSFKDSQGHIGFSHSHHQVLPEPAVIFSRSPRVPEMFVSIAASSNHLLALTALGNIFAFGTGEHGQLGRKVIARRGIN